MSAHLTFDIGITALKTALINESGRILELRSIEYTPETPRTGWAEMAADSYWQAAVGGHPDSIRCKQHCSCGAGCRRLQPPATASRPPKPVTTVSRQS